jgi:hypothetical protein
MRHSYVVPMRWMVIHEYEVPGGALNLSYTKLHRPWESSPSRQSPHGRTGNWTWDLMISSQKLWPLDHEVDLPFYSLLFYSVPLAFAECDDFLPLSGASSIPPCHILFPATLFHQTILPSSLTLSCHVFLGIPLGFVVSKFIYNTLLGILFSSVLCTCPNQRNLCSLIVGFLNKPKIYWSVHEVISVNLFRVRISNQRFSHGDVKALCQFLLHWGKAIPSFYFQNFPHALKFYRNLCLVLYIYRIW